jgi:phosphonate utilization transcriptional regulator
MDDRAERTDDLTILRTVSLTRALEREIERLILSGDLAPGERINEIQLATRFGTSRGPVREAIRSLEANGLVELVRNRGVFVRRLSVEEAVEIYDVRAALFGLAGRLLAQRATPALLAELETRLQAMDKAAEPGDFEAYYPLNLAFHDLILASAGNAALRATYRSFIKRMHLFRARSLVQGGGLSVSNREHREMVAALAAGDAERAHAAHWSHVERAKQRFLASLESAGIAEAEETDAAE